MARDALRRFAPELGPELIQVVVLLASELVSNAVRHARSAYVELRLAVADGHVRVEVGDDGEGFSAKPLRLDSSRVGGWGLYIVDELSSRWGVTEDAGNCVWFELDRR